DLISLEGKHILEFGAGHGRLALEMRGYASYLGVDISEELVRIGLERLEHAGLSDRATLVAGDCLTFDAPPAYYDIVCALGMFGNVDDAEQLLAKMVYHLRPGGTLFIDGHVRSFLYAPVRWLKWRLRPPSGGAARLFDRREVSSLFARVGLTDVRVLMREFPLLGGLYARRGWRWPLDLRNMLARMALVGALATDFVAAGHRPGEDTKGSTTTESSLPFKSHDENRRSH
ncbi:MAG TPA: class I SAM-dependent methyltransferase, partial [Gemmatimonadaceae bacterium]|nr:class I SAM-dependent methyltransferase [Gemmatimonadaceae bacterium]